MFEQKFLLSVITNNKIPLNDSIEYTKLCNKIKWRFKGGT